MSAISYEIHVLMRSRSGSRRDAIAPRGKDAQKARGWQHRGEAARATGERAARRGGRFFKNKNRNGTGV